MLNAKKTIFQTVSAVIVCLGVFHAPLLGNDNSSPEKQEEKTITILQPAETYGLEKMKVSAPTIPFPPPILPEFYNAPIFTSGVEEFLDENPLAICGDGIVDPGEDCDDGNRKDGDGCSSLCRLENPEKCGNGITDPGETCDDGNLADGDGCSATCQIEEGFCGDGIVNSQAGEECDPPGEDCTDACKVRNGDPPQCGDGKITPPETCDPPGPLCSEICQKIPEKKPVCGNGILEEGEGCDDGNLVDGDGCSSACAVEKEKKPDDPVTCKESEFTKPVAASINPCTCTAYFYREECSDGRIEETTIPFRTEIDKNMTYKVMTDTGKEIDCQCHNGQPVGLDANNMLEVVLCRGAATCGSG